MFPVAYVVLFMPRWSLIQLIIHTSLILISADNLCFSDALRLLFQLVPPRTNTTFDVVFLARQVGNVENTLYIHTSHGTFKYQVRNVRMKIIKKSFTMKKCGGS